jgi:ABC-type branched-subunit amino acid transport system substrate-binding protein
VALIAKQARDKGLNVPLVGGDGWDSAQLYTIGGQAVVGSYFTNHYSPYDTDPKVQKFVQGYQQRYGQIPDALAATAYDAALIMFDAIKRAGSTDGKAVRDALAATKDFPGVTGTVNFNANRDAVKPIMMIRVDEGGKYVIQERVVVEGAAMPTGTGAGGANTNANTTASPGTNTNTAGNANAGANTNTNANANAAAANGNAKP